MYIVRFLHQTTTCGLTNPKSLRCISSVSYIKPQPRSTRSCSVLGCISSVSYIKPQPLGVVLPLPLSCISSVSYIKPQPLNQGTQSREVVYRPFPTSNHNATQRHAQDRAVVYRPFPTSNHNDLYYQDVLNQVVYRPFPTSNHNPDREVMSTEKLYIVRFLHQTTTTFRMEPHKTLLYIVRFLHQTTTCKR